MKSFSAFAAATNRSFAAAQCRWQPLSAVSLVSFSALFPAIASTVCLPTVAAPSHPLLPSYAPGYSRCCSTASTAASSSTATMADAATAAATKALEPPQAVLDFWFGPVDSKDHGEFRKFWFQSSPDIDAEIEQRFKPLYEAAARGDLDAWAEDPYQRIALIIVLDQFPRNMFRGTAQAFATDKLAFSYAKSGYEAGMWKGFPSYYLLFAYMPMQHVEDLAGQELSLKCFKEAFGEDSGYYQVRPTPPTPLLFTAVAHSPLPPLPSTSLLSSTMTSLRSLDGSLIGKWRQQRREALATSLTPAPCAPPCFVRGPPAMKLWSASPHPRN